MHARRVEEPEPIPERRKALAEKISQYGTFARSYTSLPAYLHVAAKYGLNVVICRVTTTRRLRLTGIKSAKVSFKISQAAPSWNNPEHLYDVTDAQS